MVKGSGDGDGGEGVGEQPSAQLSPRGRDEGSHGASPCIICPVVQDPTARPKGTVPAPAEPHPPRDTTRLTFTL